eukprot:TRINITY_DN3459_c0_g1_i3.p1 TRINITY_DN3459_c0_g1~~TRINITY_DN3459_c0_g1_i3.p1  ORF type:complete len:107 (+),score=8.49 TRINITY_DN3459_c0_g1_i3:1183-1503(+)
MYSSLVLPVAFTGAGRRNVHNAHVEKRLFSHECTVSLPLSFPCGYYLFPPCGCAASMAHCYQFAVPLLRHFVTYCHDISVYSIFTSRSCPMFSYLLSQVFICDASQ